MKQVVSILLSCLLVFIALAKTGIVLHYEFNKESIAEKHCENKDKPQMHCNGHCYLSKQLKKADENAPVPNLNQLKELSPYITSAVHIKFWDMPKHNSARALYQVSFPIEACPGSVFQPPEA